MNNAAVAAAILFFSQFAAVAEAAPVRLVRATVGSRGSVHGTRYVIADPRNAFTAGVDRQVIVHFEWEGTPGTHECVVTWKDPTGLTVLTSPFAQRATTPRFSVYWTLTLPDAPRLGLWAAEAQVDGQPAGTVTFQIGEGTAAPAGTGRRVLSPQEMYARANAATVAIEALDAAGRTLHRASGFLAGEGRVATAFQAIDGATRLRVSRPGGGAAVETDKVAGWNRRQDWAVLAAAGVDGLVVPVDRTRSWKVGDRCFFLAVGDDGSRAITETAIVGAQDFAGRGARILLAAPFGPLSIGAPLLDEYGDAIGILGGALTQGGGTMVTGGTMAVPTLVALSDAPATTETLASLLARSVTVPPLVGPRNVLTGTLARSIDKRSGIAVAVDEKSEFRRSEKEAVAYLTWDPQEKRDGMGAFRIHDEDNKVVIEGKPMKLSLRPRKYLVSTWPFPLAPLKPGQYRIDFFIDADPVWRSFFRIVE